VLVSFGACSSGGIMNYLMKTDGSFYRVLIAPVQRSSIVLGQVLEAVLCTFLEVAVMCIVSLFFSVKIASGFMGLLFMILLVFMTAFFLAGLTYAISLCLPNEVVYETVMNAIVLPVFFLSTALFPAETLSGGLAIAVNLNPFTHVINALRALILQGNIAARDIIPALLLLAVMCFISFSWALHRLRKETSL
jgi:ABC-2 type transport system permease protein